MALPPVGQREDVLGGQRGGPAGVPLGEAGVLDQPGGARLDHPVLRREPRRVVGQGGCLLRGEERVGEEGAGAPGVVVGRVQDHALAAPDGQDGVADLRGGDPPALGRAQVAGELRVGDRGTEGAEGQLEPHLQDDVAAGLPLEPGRAVREAAVGEREGALRPVQAVPRAHRGDGVRDVGAVSAHVLDGGGADAARDPRKALEPAPLLLDGVRDHVVPVLPRRDPHRGAAAGGHVGVQSGRGQAYHRAGEPVVGDEQVGPAAQDQQGFAPVVAVGDQLDELTLGPGHLEAARLAAHAERGVIGQPGRGGDGGAAGVGRQPVDPAFSQRGPRPWPPRGRPRHRRWR